MQVKLTLEDLSYLLRVISYNASGNDAEGVREDRKMYNKLKKAAEKQGYKVEKF